MSDIFDDLKDLFDEEAVGLGDEPNDDEDDIPDGDEAIEIEAPPASVVSRAMQARPYRRGTRVPEAVDLEKEPPKVSLVASPDSKAKIKAVRDADAALATIDGLAGSSPAAAQRLMERAGGILRRVTASMPDMTLAEIAETYSGADAVGSAAWLGKCAASYYAMRRAVMDWRMAKANREEAVPPLKTVKEQVAQALSEALGRKIAPNTVYNDSRIWETFFLNRSFADGDTGEREDYNPWLALDVLEGKSYFEVSLNVEKVANPVAMLAVMVEKRLADPKYGTHQARADVKRVNQGVSLGALAAGETPEVVRPARSTGGEAERMKDTLPPDPTDYIMAIHKGAMELAALETGKVSFRYVYRDEENNRFQLYQTRPSPDEIRRLADEQGNLDKGYALVLCLYMAEDGTISVIERSLQVAK